MILQDFRIGGDMLREVDGSREKLLELFHFMQKHHILLWEFLRYFASMTCLFSKFQDSSTRECIRYEKSSSFWL